MTTTAPVSGPLAGPGGPGSRPVSLQAAVASAWDWFRRITEPAATGLPRWPMLWWFPAVLLVGLIVLVALGISGSSTGSFWRIFGTGNDPDLIAGIPRDVRSDEWLTFGPLLVSQAAQNYPEFNQAFPGGGPGVDTTVLLDLPSWSWITLFRPNAIGFLFLGLDHGLAFRWWFSAFAVMTSGYLMLITLLPRRPLTSAVIAVAFFFCPLLQWWFVPSTVLPAALCMLAIAAVLFSLRDDRLLVRIGWSAATGYLAVATVLTFYPPYIIPCVLVAAAFSAGTLLDAAGPGRTGFARAASRLVPLGIGAVTAVAVVGIFLVTHSATITSFYNTVYPGHRVQAAGAVGFDGLVQFFSAPFAESLKTGGIYTGALGSNNSEAATPVLVGLFLVIPLTWFAVHDRRILGRWQWAIVGCLAMTLLLIAFQVLPGWDPIARLLLLDRTVIPRIRIGFSVLSVLTIGLLVNRLDHSSVMVPWSVTWATAGAATASIVVVWASLARGGDSALTTATHHRIIAVLFVLAVILFTRGLPLLASIAFLIISLVLGAGINPLYRGIFDLRETTMGAAVARIEAQRPGHWLGIGSRQLSSVLVESGVPSYNGVQLYPSREMWSTVDPTDVYEDQWNRYATLQWAPGSGDPVLSNPWADIINATFDSCSSFGQQSVTYVLAEVPLEQPCLREIDHANQGAADYRIYLVTPPR